jgi:hypothetical protein
MSRLGLILVVLVLYAAGAHAQSTSWLNVRQFGAICDGQSHPLSQKYATLADAQAVYPFVTSLSQQIDYAALKATSNAAFGADGSEHGSANPQLNVPVYIPHGICYLGADTWTIRNLSGGRIIGDGPLTTQIEGSGNAVLAFDGLWYSTLDEFEIIQQSRSSTTALDVDGNTGTAPYSTFGVQADSFYNIVVNGGGATYAVSVCRQGGSGGQCSEMTWENLHAQNAAFAVYYQNGFNALGNVLVGGDLQNYPRNGIYLVAGSIKILGMSFESTTGYTQIDNGGCDITANSAGVEDSILAYGDRTESLCFYNGSWSQWADIRGLTHLPGFVSWRATSNYALNAVTEQTATDGNPYMYRVTAAGTSGGSAPTWPTSGTVTDGTVVWTKTSYDAVSIAEGSFDAATSHIDPAARVIEGSPVDQHYSNCGAGPTFDIGSTRYHGTVTEGSGATGCTIGLNFWMAMPAPVCIVNSPNGAVLTSYTVTEDARFRWKLTIVNPPSAKNGGNRFTWICQQ